MFKLAMKWLTAGYLWILIIAYLRDAYGEHDVANLMFGAGGVPVLAYNLYSAIVGTSRRQALTDSRAEE